MERFAAAAAALLVGIAEHELGTQPVLDEIDLGAEHEHQRLGIDDDPDAVGIDDSGVMEYFVRFTRGANAAIGFHSIPTKDGRPLQTAAELGTPQSHGCIRQALPDAVRLWTFAPVGTKVVVIR